jgi:tellurite resistance protein
MVREAAGIHIPAFMRRADCSSVPGVVAIERREVFVSIPRAHDPSSTAGLGPYGALAAIAIGAARADGSVVSSEADRVEHTLGTLPIFREHSAETLRGIVEMVVSQMRNGQADSVVRRAAESLPSRLRGTAFTIGVDVMLADGRLHPSEAQFMEELRVLLRVRRSFAAKVIIVLRTKNFAWSSSKRPFPSTEH